MRNLILLSLIILAFGVQTNAQWYYRNCGVAKLDSITSSEFECLWKKSTNKVVTGGVLTGIGTSLFVGTLIVAANSNLDTGPESEYTVVYIGAFAFVAGIGIFLDYVGIPILIVGVSRKSKLRKLPNYDEFIIPEIVHGKDDRYISIAPEIATIYIDHSQFYGLSISFNF